jgi:hypothetical protein
MPIIETQLTHKHFFLSGFLKKGIYLKSAQSLKELKHNVEQTVANNNPETLY